MNQRETGFDKDYEAIALSQAETLTKQAERIRELIRQRNTEQVKTDRAISIAITYARQAGADIDEDDVRAQAEHDDRLIEQVDRRAERLEGFRDAIVRTLSILYLQKQGKEETGLTPDEVRTVQKFIASANSYACDRNNTKPSGKPLTSRNTRSQAKEAA